MQTTNATYNSIVAGRYSVEYKVEIAGVTYNQSEIIVSGGYPTETSALFEKFGIGNAVAGSLEIWLEPKGTIAPMERIDVYFRVKNATLTSNWYPKGKYYIDTRQTDKNGIIHFTAYDSMLMTEYIFMESGAWTSTDAESTVDMICSDISLTLNAETRAILSGDPKSVPYVPVIGPNGTTAREMLEWIAVLYGGNFIIDELGQLKLVQVKLPGKNLFNIKENYIEQGSILSASGADTAGTTRLRTYGYIPVEPNTTYTVSCGINRVLVIQYPNASLDGYVNRSSGWQSGNGYTFTTNAATHYIRMTFSVNDSQTVTQLNLSWVMLNTGSSALPYEPYLTGLDLGKQMVTLDVSPAFLPIDRVIIRSGNEDGVGYRSPNVSDSAWSQMTGRVLRAACPWTSQAVADGVLSIVSGFIYQPYEAGGANLNPAAQLGDTVTLNGTTSIIYSETLTLDARCAANISAPYDEEVDHEYPYRSPAQRRLDNTATMQDIDGMVTHEELQTAGQTSINGSNIHSGTITLGGNGNGEGELHILDADDTECGSWDNNGIVIYDNSEQSGSIYGDNKIRIIRQGDSADTTNALKMGVNIIDEYPDLRVPYIELRGKSLENGGYVDAVTFISSQQLLMSRGNDHLEIKQYSSGVTTTSTKTDSSSTANMTSRTVKTWGKVVQMTVHLTNANYAGAGAVMWEGDIEPQQGATLPQPVDQVTASGVNGANFCIGQLTGDAANNKWHLVVRAVNGYQANWTANVSFTFLV